MKKIVCALMLLLTTACSTSKYAYHTAYKLTGCGQVVSRQNVSEALVHRGYLHSSDSKNPYDIYHRPEIVRKGSFAQEPYEDKAGDIAVAICTGGAENYLLTEEWTGCKDHKDCTADNQRDLRKLAQDWGCQISERSGHSESWKLEDRQDWTKDSCPFIAAQLTF